MAAQGVVETGAVAVVPEPITGAVTVVPDPVTGAVTVVPVPKDGVVAAGLVIRIDRVTGAGFDIGSLRFVILRCDATEITHTPTNAAHSTALADLINTSPILFTCRSIAVAAKPLHLKP
jgi:hypothetical protein